MLHLPEYHCDRWVGPDAGEQFAQQPCAHSATTPVRAGCEVEQQHGPGVLQSLHHRDGDRVVPLPGGVHARGPRGHHAGQFGQAHQLAGRKARHQQPLVRLPKGCVLHHDHAFLLCQAATEMQVPRVASWSVFRVL